LAKKEKEQAGDYQYAKETAGDDGFANCGAGIAR
jgi:hypothetical protein